VTKQLCRPRIRTTDYAIGIRDKYRVGGNIKKILEPGLSELGPIV
jgi:hypothetical protein